MDKWFYEKGGREVGPVTSAQLTQLARWGTVGPDTPVRQGTKGKWLAASRVKGLLEGASRESDQAAEWYYEDHGQRVGPVPFSELKRVAKEKGIGPDAWFHTPDGVPELEPDEPFPVGPRRASPARLLGLLLVAAGAALLIAAYAVNRRVDDSDLRSLRLDNAKHQLAINLGGQPGDYHETPKGDRAPVYVLCVVGAIFIGFGCVCYAIAGATT
jgi:hypothetical protein